MIIVIKSGIVYQEQPCAAHLLELHFAKHGRQQRRLASADRADHHQQLTTSNLQGNQDLANVLEPTYDVSDESCAQATQPGFVLFAARQLLTHLLQQRLPIG